MISLLVSRLGSGLSRPTGYCGTAGGLFGALRVLKGWNQIEVVACVVRSYTAASALPSGDEPHCDAGPTCQSALARVLALEEPVAGKRGDREKSVSLTRLQWWRL